MKKNLILFIIFPFVCCVLIFLIFGIWQNFLVFKALKSAKLDQVSFISQRAVFLPKTLNWLTFKQIEVFKLWELLLEESSTAQTIVNNSQQYLAEALNEQTSDPELAKKIIEDLEKINIKLNKIDIKALNDAKLLINDLLIITKNLLQTDQRYVVILQNSDELRATGGFFGSFFILENKHGQIAPIKIQDVYVPDGQFTAFLEAPPGLKEYLSSGKGLRLPDANWWPNFADSAEQILYFFEQIDAKPYQGVIAINLQVIEQLLELSGAVYLPDYDTFVDHHNFAQIARADRQEFFPGSQEKANFLNHFFKFFKLQLSQTLQKEPKKSLLLIKQLLASKDVQIYSRDQVIAPILEKRNLTGKMLNQQELYYFLVESNVGINKTNRLVDRQVKIQIAETVDTIMINWQNNNPLPYVNYQRLYTNFPSAVLSLKINGTTIKDFAQNKFVTREGQEFMEIGFLVPVLAENQTQVEIELKNSLSIEAKKKLFIQKQAGLTAPQYTITYQAQSRDFKLTSDQSLIFD